MFSSSVESADARTALLTVFLKRNTLAYHQPFPVPTSTPKKSIAPRYHNKKRTVPLPGAFHKDIAFCREGGKIFAMPAVHLKGLAEHKSPSARGKAMKERVYTGGSSARLHPEHPPLERGHPPFVTTTASWPPDLIIRAENKAAAQEWNLGVESLHAHCSREDTPPLIIDTGSDSDRSDGFSPLQRGSPLPWMDDQRHDHDDEILVAARIEEMFSLFIHAEACGDEAEIHTGAD